MRSGWLWLLAACAPATRPSKISNRPAPTSVTRCHEGRVRGPDRLPSSDGERIVDADDRCPALPIECLAGFDDQDIDGCPDAPPLAIGFELGSAAVPSAAGPTLDRIANDARHLARGATLIVVGGAGVHEASDLSTRRARAIVEALLERCVDRERIEISSIGPEDFEGRDPPPNRVMIDTRGCE